MGIFGTMSSVGKINSLLIKVETQIQRVCVMKEDNRSENQIRMELREIGQMYNEAKHILEECPGARGITYSCMGQKMYGREIPDFIKGAIITLTFM